MKKVPWTLVSLGWLYTKNNTQEQILRDADALARIQIAGQVGYVVAMAVAGGGGGLSLLLAVLGHATLKNIPHFTVDLGGITFFCYFLAYRITMVLLNKHLPK